MVQEKGFLKEFRGFAKEVLKRLGFVENRLGALEKEVKEIKFDRRQDWQEQREFNGEIKKRFDVIDDSLMTLDKRVRYQEDMPERLEQVEKDTYELKRRVAKVEAST